MRIPSHSTRKLHSVDAALSGLRRVDCVKMVEADRPRELKKRHGQYMGPRGLTSRNRG